MDHHAIVNLMIFAGFFLTLIAILQTVTKKLSFPYTISLLIVGFICQFLVHSLGLHVELELTSDVIFYILLPLLLFESAMHINFHQFKLQFKTITFISTFGLLVSVFAIGALIAYGLGLPFQVALLFGAMISATDPIAVLALFKSLGAPKRLGLLADGESMFNDATGVIAFRIVSSFVVAKEYFESGKLVDGAGTFLYVFVGSILIGLLLGYISSKIVAAVKGDHVVESIITIALALGSFIFAEHFLKLSGVIATVMAGITLGNIGKTKFSSHALHSIHSLWENIGFVSLSLVFFFAAFNLNIYSLFITPKEFIVVIGAVLIGRALSVYLSFFITNNLRIFKDEPNVPLSWQHIINWGGLRGVIPLVLAYSLSSDFEYRELLLSYTLITLLFTLFVNGLTIKSLLIKLNLHIPPKQDTITDLENKIFEIEESRQKLKALPEGEFSREDINASDKEMQMREEEYKRELLKTIDPQDFERCLSLQTIEIERKSVQELFSQGYINEKVLTDLEAELDLQYDAIEHPGVYEGHEYEKGGKINRSRSFRNKLDKLKQVLKNYPILKTFVRETKEQLIADRFSLLKARIISSREVLDFLKHTKDLLSSNKIALNGIKHLEEIHNTFISKNSAKIEELNKEYPAIINEYQHELIHKLLENKSIHIGH